MPAFSTHYIFAKEMMPFLKKTACFDINEDAVYFGAQGPDIFFFHRIMPWMIGKPLLKYGSLLHNAKPSDLFENMRNYCNISKYAHIAKSYVYGFILHYALDRSCHPYVYCLQNEITDRHRFTNPHSAHNTIEFSLDSYMLSKRLGIKCPSAFNTAETVSSDERVTAEIGRLLEYIIPKTIGKQITAKQGELALRDMKYIQELTRDPKGIKHLFVAPVELLLAPFSKNYKFTSLMRPKDLEKAKKYANIDNRVWQSPFANGERCESFEDLFELSKKDAEQMTVLYQDGADCREITENKSFLTGVEIK